MPRTSQKTKRLSFLTASMAVLVAALVMELVGAGVTAGGGMVGQHRGASEGGAFADGWGDLV